MPPKAKPAQRWGNDEKEAILKGFRERGWDPSETDGKKINKVLKSEPDLFKVLKPFFSLSDGGSKTSNNQLYQHYKDLGCEFILLRTRSGIRRKEGAFAIVIIVADRTVLTFFLVFS